MWLIKLDIKQFYEQIDKKALINLVLNDSKLSYFSKTLLNKFFTLPQIQQTTGLPRGIAISAVLSEIYMRQFDLQVVREPGVYFYARYVDDIIVFAFSPPTELLNRIDSILQSTTSLHFNRNKTKIIERKRCRCKPICQCVSNCKCRDKCQCQIERSKYLNLEYLGYRFAFSDLARDTEVEISLAKRKINKIKSRVVMAFLDFSKKNNFQLLEDRIAFLTGNFIAKKNKVGQVNAGIYYNYQYINSTGLNDLAKLTLFLRKLLNCKNGTFSQKFTQLTPDQRAALSKYCFKSGHENRRLKNFQPSRINLIKQCWSYGN
jgi:hypothetical protein